MASIEKFTKNTIVEGIYNSFFLDQCQISENSLLYVRFNLFYVECILDHATSLSALWRCGEKTCEGNLLLRSLRKHFVHFQTGMVEKRILFF